MPLVLPNVIENDTPADAAEVQQNYGVTQQYVNTNVIQRDGSVAMQAPLTLFGSPSSDLHAVTKAYVDALLPVGVIMPYGGAVAPAGRWALCNGASLSSADQPKLFSIIGYRFGGNGGLFTLPNLAGRMMIGVDPLASRFDTTGKAGGSFAAVNAPHTHPINHDHGSVTATTSPDTHAHALSQPPLLRAGSGHNGLVANGIFEPINYFGSPGVILPDTHDHTVAVNLPAFSGTSGSSGTTGAEQIPPYVIVNYIIRLD